MRRHRAVGRAQLAVVTRIHSLYLPANWNRRVIVCPLADPGIRGPRQIAATLGINRRTVKWLVADGPPAAPSAAATGDHPAQAPTHLLRRFGSDRQDDLVMQPLGRTDLAFTSRVYSHTLRRGDHGRARLKPLVEGLV